MAWQKGKRNHADQIMDGPAGQFPYSGSASGGQQQIDDGSTRKTFQIEKFILSNKDLVISLLMIPNRSMLIWKLLLSFPDSGSGAEILRRRDGQFGEHD